MMDMAAAMREAVGEMRRQNGNGNGNGSGIGTEDGINVGGTGQMTLATFLKVNPPSFKGTTNPSEADNWLQAMKMALEA